MLEVCWDGGLWTLSFGLSQFQGHGSWLVCEVALSNTIAHDNEMRALTLANIIILLLLIIMALSFMGATGRAGDSQSQASLHHSHSAEKQY